MLQRILVRVLGVDPLARAEREFVSTDSRDLILPADQVDLDPLLGADVLGPVLEAAEVDELLSHCDEASRKITNFSRAL